MLATATGRAECDAIKLLRERYEDATFGRDNHNGRLWDDDAYQAALAHEQKDRLALPGARGRGGLMILTYTDTTCRDGRHHDCPGSWESTPAEIRCTCRCHWETAFDLALFPDDHPRGGAL